MAKSRPVLWRTPNTDHGPEMDAAMADALARAAAHFDCPAGPAEPGWAADLPVVTAWAPVGPSAAALPPALRVRRRWDDAAWPRATRGYFQVKAAIPAILQAAGTDGSAR